MVEVDMNYLQFYDILVPIVIGQLTYIFLGHWFVRNIGQIIVPIAV